MSKRVTPSERMRVEVDEVFAGGTAPSAPPSSGWITVLCGEPPPRRFAPRGCVSRSDEMST